MGEAWHDSGLVFIREDRPGLHPEYVTRHFLRLTKGPGLRQVRLHDLRRGQASLRPQWRCDMLRRRRGSEETTVLANATLITPVPVTDLDRARAFYTDLLGLPVLFEDPAQRIIIVGVGGAMLELGEHAAPSAGHHSCAVFHVANPQAMDSVVEALHATGVACERRDAHVPLDWDDRDVATFDGRMTAWFRDPDGNLLQLYTRDISA